ncbi:hypothetical protein ACP275_02G093300 [Erythranthe tilingii]
MMMKNNICLFLVISVLVVVVVHAYDKKSLLAGQNNGVAWCVAKDDADIGQVQQFLDYACSELSCEPIQPGNPCFDPPTVLAHGSYVLNAYFNQFGVCSPKIGRVVPLDPSYGDCHYPGRPQ